MLWNDEVGAWLDYDILNDKQRNYFLATNLSPLWMRCYDPTKREHIAERVVHYINNTKFGELKLDDFPGGVPTSFNPTGEFFYEEKIQQILIKN
mgnify:CR=1 FL=1